jgi:tetratricopeptide (TPR) repeat protein
MPRLRLALISCALAIATLVTYMPVRHAQFLRWDDQNYVMDNPHVRAGLRGPGFGWAFTTPGPPYWQPLTWLSHMTDVQLFGLDASRHHAVNVVIHTCNALLVLAVLLAMTGAVWRSAFVAAVFALHPLHVESVAWIAERKDVLSTFFLLLSLLAYVRYVRRPAAVRYGLVVVTYCAALMSKPMVVTYPFVLLLIDVWPLQRRLSRTTLLEKTPLVLLAAAVAVQAVLMQNRLGVVATTTAFPWGERIAITTTSYVAYLGQAFWPAKLAAFYPWRSSPPPMAVVAEAALLVAISTGAFLTRRSRPYLAVGWAWFVITLLPVIGLLRAGEQSRADRYVYLPLLGLAIAVTWGIGSLVAGRVARVAVACLSAVALVGCAAAAYRQAEYWQTDVTLWEHAVAVTSDNYLAHDLLGLAYAARGETSRALAEYAEALRVAPPRAEPDFAGLVENNIGAALLREGQAVQARAHFAKAAQLNPASPDLRYDYGAALVSIGQYAAAADEFRAALAANHPRPSDVQSDLGLALLSGGRPDEAMQAFIAAVQLDPSNANAENGLGACLSTRGQDADAIAHYQAAIRLKPDFALAYANLAGALLHLGRSADALNALLDAVRLDPNQPSWEFNAGVLLAQTGRHEDARAHYERVIALQPQSELAQRARAMMR